LPTSMSESPQISSLSTSIAQLEVFFFFSLFWSEISLLRLEPVFSFIPNTSMPFFLIRFTFQGQHENELNLSGGVGGCPGARCVRRPLSMAQPRTNGDRNPGSATSSHLATSTYLIAVRGDPGAVRPFSWPGVATRLLLHLSGETRNRLVTDQLFPSCLLCPRFAAFGTLGVHITLRNCSSTIGIGLLACEA
jgi:hypothetical protein